MALEVGVGRMVLAGQFKMAHPGLQGEFAHHAPPGKILQDPVDGDLIYPAAGADQLQDLPGPEGPGASPRISGTANRTGVARRPSWESHRGKLQ